MSIRKPFLISVGVGLVLLGPFTMISPIPGGSLVLPCGTALLICESKLCREGLCQLRARYTWLNRLMIALENRTGQKLGGVIKRTNPSISSPVQPADEIAEND